MFTRTGLLCCLMAVCLLPVGAAQAEVDSDLDYPVKAAFLYKFALYVEWPESVFENAESPVLIGVQGPQRVLDQVGTAVRDRSLAGRPLAVTQVGDQDISRFHVLFLVRSAEGCPPPKAIPGDLPVLVVTETADWQDWGGVINFVLMDDRIRFDVDLASAGKRGLSLSSQLLNVARHIQGRP